MTNGSVTLTNGACYHDQWECYLDQWGVLPWPMGSVTMANGECYHDQWGVLPWSMGSECRMILRPSQLNSPYSGREHTIFTFIQYSVDLFYSQALVLVGSYKKPWIQHKVSEMTNRRSKAAVDHQTHARSDTCAATDGAIMVVVVVVMVVVVGRPRINQRGLHKQMGASHRRKNS